MRRSAPPLAMLGMLATAFATREALASSGYPERLERDLSLTRAPACSLCHGDADGGAETPFGSALTAHGLRPDDVDSLQKALDGLRSDDVDSDGDGARDLDELAWGGDPNRADLPVGGEAPTPAYGCSTVRNLSGPGSPVTAALGTLAFLRRFRRRNRQGSGPRGGGPVRAPRSV